MGVNDLQMEGLQGGRQHGLVELVTRDLSRKVTVHRPTLLIVHPFPGVNDKFQRLQIVLGPGHYHGMISKVPLYGKLEGRTRWEMVVDKGGGRDWVICYINALKKRETQVHEPTKWLGPKDMLR